MSDKEKIKALLEGLEIQHIDTFMISSTVGDYRKLGQAYAKKAFEAVEKAKRFDGAVEVEPIQGVTWLEHDSSVPYPRTVTKSTKTHKLYAIPKEQCDD